MTYYFNMKMSDAEIGNISSLGLAHIGDAVFELMVRAWLCKNGKETSAVLHKETVKYVSAPAQAAAIEKIMPRLEEREKEIFRRARNAKVNSVPSHATIGQYHAATGLEALFGYLYLRGEKERLNELFNMIMEEAENVT